MKRERRQPTRREWAAITSRRPVVRRVPPPEVSHNTSRRLRPGPNGEECPAGRGEAKNEEGKGAI